jgi:hypothetical protein
MPDPTSLFPAGWEAAVLLQRHYGALPQLLVDFIRGPDQDGPVISLETAIQIVEETYGRRSRCTYAGFKIVDATTFRQQVRDATRERFSIAEARAFVSCLGGLAINQPLCANGHLPARFVGPVNFVFQGTDQQCPKCGERILDPDPTEFVLVWVEKRLGHSAEKESNGGDGRLVPNRGENLRQAIGTLHPFFVVPEGAVQPNVTEIAMVLFHGLADGVPAIRNGIDVIAAMRDPERVGLDKWKCGNVLRKATNAAKLLAHNPFRVAAKPSMPEHVETAEGLDFKVSRDWSWNRGASVNDLGSLMLLVEDFGVEFMNGFVRANENPNIVRMHSEIRWNAASAVVALELAIHLKSHGFADKPPFYLSLGKWMPSRAGDVLAVARIWRVNITEDDFCR